MISILTLFLFTGSEEVWEGCRVTCESCEIIQPAVVSGFEITEEGKYSSCRYQAR
jgi:hypothetical protein